MDNQLKPCPFCGKTYVYVSEILVNSDTCYAVVCPNFECDIIGPAAFDRAAAIAAWNTRPLEARLRAALDTAARRLGERLMEGVSG